MRQLNWCEQMEEQLKKPHVDAVKNFKPGDLVVDRTRLPTKIQPWIHPGYVGVVLALDDDYQYGALKMTKKEYYDKNGYIEVLYSFGARQSNAGDLVHTSRTQNFWMVDSGVPGADGTWEEFGL